jgi:glucose/mannose-6-phosphate isomerase
MDVDRQDMKRVLKDFPQQVVDAIRLGKEAEIPQLNFDSIIFCGMGGSAVGGDIMASLIKSIPISVLRSYDIPEWIGENTLAFVISYSGNTEETLSAYQELKKTSANIICVTSDGKLAECKPSLLIRIPSGFQPRCAIGYLFFPVFMVLKRLGVVDFDVDELLSILTEMSRDLENEDSVASALASKLLDRLPIIYAASPLEAVAKRWQTQFNENSKVVAHINIFPELNHNEIVGFGNPKIDNLVIIFKDTDYSPRIEKRIAITKEIISPYTSGIEEVYTVGDSPLTRLFSLMYLGDWTSYHLAVKRGVDPTSVERIAYLKDHLDAD